MAGKNNANIGFEKQIWDAACELWGHIPAADYRKVIVGLIFLRYISFAFEKRYQELVAEGDGFENDKDAYTEENIFFVPEKARWSTIAAAAHTPEIGIVIDEAMRAIEDENKVLKNVLPKNYANQDLDKRVLGNVVDLFTNNIDMSGTDEDKDLLGRTYEYCIAQFAAYEGTKGGEFYTPSSIVKTIVEVLKPFDIQRVERTLRRIAASGENVTSSDNTGKVKSSPGRKMMIRGRESTNFIDIDEIVMVERQGKSTIIHTIRDEYNTSMGLGDIEEKLTDSKFIRSHKSFIINMDYVSRIEPYGRWTYIVKFNGKDYDALITSSKYDEIKKIYG